MSSTRHLPRQRGLWLALLATAVLVGCSAIAVEGDGRASLRRAGSVAYPERYRFVDRPDAPGLQRCFTDEVEVGVAVDRVAGVASIMPVGLARPVAVVADGVGWVDAAWVTDGQLTGWIEVSGDDPADVRSLLFEAVGPSVAAYLAGFALPASPSVIATGARESASAIEQLDDGTVSAVIDRLASIDQVGSDTSGGGDVLAFDATFAFDGAGRVISVAARPAADATVAGGEDEVPFGYVLDYDWTADIPLDRPDPTAVTPVSAVIDKIVVPIRSAFECSVGG